MSNTHTYLLIQDAIDNGINMEWIVKSLGIDEHTFMQYHRDCLFSGEQEEIVRRQIRLWRKGE